MNPYSLKQAADSLRISKSTLHRHCKAMGIPTDNGLTDADLDRLQLELDKIPPTQKVAVQTGNHAKAITLAVPVQSSDLANFRTDRIRQQLANPDQFLANITGVLDQIEDAMDEAESVQEAELAKIRQVKSQTQKRLDAFKLRGLEYRIKSDVLAAQQNAELEQLAQTASELQSLGKSSDD